MPGNHGQVKRLAEEFDGNGRVNVEEVMNPHTLAGFLKKIFKASLARVWHEFCFISRLSAGDSFSGRKSAVFACFGLFSSISSC